MAAKQDWNRADIKAALEKKGLRLQDLDRAHDLPFSATSLALQRPYEGPEKIIAEAIGVTPQEIWPSRFDEDGKRLKPQPRANYVGRPVIRHRKIGAAA